MSRNTLQKTLVAVSVGLLFGAYAQADATLPTVRAAIDRLAATSGATPNVSIHEATGGVSFVRAPKGGKLQAQASARSVGEVDKHNASQQFFRDHSGLFGIANVDTELSAATVQTDRQGFSHLTRKQVYHGLPVLGGELKSHFDAAGNLYSVNGSFIPGINVNPSPSFTAEQASKIALARVAASNAGKKISAGKPELMIYRQGLTQGISGDNHLVWQVEVGNGSDVREFVYVGAHSSKIVDQITGIHDGLNRRAYDGQGKLPPVPNYPNNPFWVEGQGLPTGVAEADNMLNASADIFNLFKNGFGRDSFDGKGATMHSIFNRGDACPNASWNGTYISFCPGTTTDDVTAHEWGHAYTQYTHGLIYSYQSGALNEAYSDIWGETVDRLNGRGGDTPDAARTNACVVNANAPKTEVEITAPAAIAGVKATGAAGFGPTSFILSGSVMGIGGLDPLACSALPANSLAGKIAFIDRGTCSFVIKVKNAQNAGATGVIIGNNTGSTAIIAPGGVDATITIPTLSVTQLDGTAIKEQLANGVTAKLSRTAGGATPAYNNVRWLVGEDSTAFGGAIRDMYSPTCYGNPGKVSDVQYACSAADNGGVHGNSGVPNHGYALLVDGGNYNGQTIAGIGLTKAAHLYYRAQSVYQGPSSGFAAHADALAASCKDLTGKPLNDLKTGNVSGDVITESDCAQVDKMALAVELRTAPTQCGFGPILKKSPPALCAAGTVTSLLSDNFEGGRRGGAKWLVSYAGVNPSFTPRNWSVISGLPGGRPGSAIISYHPNNQSCATNVNQAGAQYLDSPEVTVPADGLKLSFDHFVLTEPGFDGGNVQYSVNGAAWKVVPATAFVYNGYNAVLTSVADGNDDPLAGQPGFSGNDLSPIGTAAGGSWGRSIVDLSKLTGVATGAKVKLRFASGNDGCGAPLGWIVDDVNVYSCKP
ncbi:M4 family metallopeptidase [Roseateles albus]|uniref:M4 family metallopeptidase n=1 Tax=Roseateles albus TaxID=2987525 RepID=A0ABT5K8F8_9BURK|nr:M4 family metallopeptidase [Roseateles albus]MDC8770231.1 M4 family metallopeptidase [Roseateles albus]